MWVGTAGQLLSHCRARSSTAEWRGGALATILACCRKPRSPPIQTAEERIVEPSNIPEFEPLSYSLISLGSKVRSLEVLSSAWLHSLRWHMRTSSSQVFGFLCSVPCQGKGCSYPSRRITHETRADRLFPECFGHSFLSPGILNYNF